MAHVGEELALRRAGLFRLFLRFHQLHFNVLARSDVMAKDTGKFAAAMSQYLAKISTESKHHPARADGIRTKVSLSL